MRVVRTSWVALVLVTLHCCLGACVHGFTLGGPELDSLFYAHPDLHVLEVHSPDSYEEFSTAMNKEMSKAALRREQGEKNDWQRLVSQCLDPLPNHNHKLPFCRFGPRWSQRIRALLERTWAPQTHPELTEIANDAYASHIDLSSLSNKKLRPCQEPPAERRRAMGRKAKVIVFAALNEGAMCSAATTDWKRNLPVMLGKFLGARVITYGHLTNTCSYCHHPEGEATPGCVDDILAGPDALIVVGSGSMFSSEHACKPEEGGTCQQQFFDLWQLLSTDWAKATKQLIHITDANAQKPLAEGFGFDVVIDESHFVKPVSKCTREAMLMCHLTWPALKLVYPGKISRENGQYDFLQAADPRILEEYTIHFYGSDANVTEVEAVRKIAREKKFLIQIHGEVSKINFLHSLCSANGMVLFGRERNPAALYEGIAAGLPVLLSIDAITAYQRRGPGEVTDGTGWTTVGPKELLSQPFVQVVDRSKEHQSQQWKHDINKEIFDLMDRMGEDWMWMTKDWSSKFMDEEAVYTDLCQRMCLCDGGPCTDEAGNHRIFKPRPRIHHPPGPAREKLAGKVAAQIAKVLLLGGAEQQHKGPEPPYGEQQHDDAYAGLSDEGKRELMMQIEIHHDQL
mmetsp:Transcript_22460/g.62298  ORF Transcript_22460/g.62298 Transcript_22460/m.62298 type:complete len:625 (-) Transcript_22460:375-2249(-)